MTVSRQHLRVLLYGCSHKPRFMGLTTPKKGEWITCYPCRTGRMVKAIESGWKYANAKCQSCKWSVKSDSMTRKKLFHLSHRHADAWDHTVAIINLEERTYIKPARSTQLAFPDECLLSETVTET